MSLLIVNEKYNGCSVVDEELDGGAEVFSERDDNAVLTRLIRETTVKGSGDCKSSLTDNCTLLFADSASLWQVMNLGLPDSLLQKADVLVTTIEDLMAKSLLIKMPGISSPFPPLDRIPQGYASGRTVHLVIFGSTDMAEALAVNAALVAHYPNYCRDSRLRTRITLVDSDVFSLRDRMLLRYHRLFEHSYHRSIDLFDNDPQCLLNRPLYEGKRRDFVDVEWEFVRGNASSQAVRQKLSEWAEMETQQLTVAICGNDYGENAVIAHTIPEKIYDNGVPILYRSASASRGGTVPFETQACHQANIFRFSESDCHIESLRMLKRMAMMVNYLYNHCFALPPEVPIVAPSSIDFGEAQRQWSQLTSFGKRYSNIHNAMALGTKLHSVGLSSDDWNSYYALSKDEIQLLAEVEHNRWSVEELILGYRPTTAEEDARIEQEVALKKQLREHRIHYDLRAFDDLRTDATGKNVNVYDLALTQGIPLILKSCITD